MFFPAFHWDDLSNSVCIFLFCLMFNSSQLRSFGISSSLVQVLAGLSNFIPAACNWPRCLFVMSRDLLQYTRHLSFFASVRIFLNVVLIIPFFPVQFKFPVFVFNVLWLPEQIKYCTCSVICFSKVLMYYFKADGLSLTDDVRNEFGVELICKIKILTHRQEVL